MARREIVARELVSGQRFWTFEAGTVELIALNGHSQLASYYADHAIRWHVVSRNGKIGWLYAESFVWIEET